MYGRFGQGTLAKRTIKADLAAYECENEAEKNSFNVPNWLRNAIKSHDKPSLSLIALFLG